MKIAHDFGSLFGLAMLALSSAPALAQGADGPSNQFSVDGAVSFVSDYRFRGYSISDKKPAIQPELWVSHESGVYAGFWGSNVADLGGDGIELDPAIGLAKTIGPVDVDIWAMYYLYPGAFEYNYAEFGSKFSTAFGGATVGLVLGYAPAQDNIGGTDNRYASILLSARLAATPISIDGSFGVEDGAFGDKKLDWTLGLSATVAGVELDAHYVDAARHGGDLLADPAVVASVKYSF